MKRIIAAAAVITAAVGLWAYEYRESTNADIRKAPWMAFDGSIETYWNLSEGETEGFIEAVEEDSSNKGKVTIDCDIPAGGEIQLYEETGNGRTAISGCSKSGPYSGILEFEVPAGRKESSVIGLRLTGQTASGIQIREINIEERSEEDWGKIQPSSYEFNLEEQINIKPARLWDGKVSGAWYEPVWYVPYEITSAKENRSKEIFGTVTGEPSKAGQIIWNLDGEYEIETIKSYIQRSFRSVKVEYEENGRWKKAVEMGPYGQKDESWVREETGGIKTEKLRITFPGGWEQARYITELEVWGKRVSGKEKKGTGWQEIKGIEDIETGNLWYIFESAKEDIEIEAGIEGTAGSTEAYLNGEKLEAIGVQRINGNMIIRYKAGKELLRNGEQFLKMENPETKSLLVKKYSDKGKLGKTVKKASYERLVEIKEDGRIKETNLNGNTKLPQIEEDTVETEKYGSVLEDEECDVELYRPWTEDENWNGYIIGWTGNSQAEVKVNGTGVSRSDHIFYLPADRLSWKSVNGRMIIEGKDGQKTYSHIYPVKGGKKQTGGELNISESLEYTAKETYEIKGKATGWNASVYINGQKVSCDRNGNFTSTVELGGGYQKTEIEVRENGNTTAYWTKETFRFTDEIKIEVSGSEKGILTKEDTWLLKGSAYNAGEVRVYIDGKETETESGHFEKEIRLSEGENRITISAEDKTGRKSEKTIVITRDTTPPLFEITKPEEGAYLAESLLEIKALSDEKGLWYEIEGSVREYAETEEYTKTFELEDDFYSWKIAAYDRLGNRSKTTVLNFCIDTEMPEEFEIIPDVPSSIEKWRDTNDVTVEFGTTDATSGVEKYEYILDNEEWKECESPLKLGELEDGKHMLYVRAADRSGNIRLETLEIYVDVTAPLSFEQSADIEAEKWTSCNEPVLYFETKDETSGIRNYTLSIDGAKEFDFTSGEKVPVLEEGRRTLTITAYDWAGNSVSTTKEYWIDNSNPVFTAASLEFTKADGTSYLTKEIEGKKWINKDTLTINYSIFDALSGVASLKYNGKRFYEEKIITKETVKDQAGNEYKNKDGQTVQEEKISYIEHEETISGVMDITENSYVLKSLKDGAYKITVIITDNVGNKAITEISFNIDNTVPVMEDCRLISGDGNMQGVWSAETPETDREKYTYTCIWQKEDEKNEIRTNELTYFDDNVPNGTYVNLTVYVTDRAGNRSEAKSAVTSVSGITVKMLNPLEPTLVEYENVKLVIPCQSETSRIKGVIVQEKSKSEGYGKVITKKSVNPVLSPIYSFTALVENEGETTVSKHAEFEEPYTLILSYDPVSFTSELAESDKNLLSSFLEENLGVYYYDDFWGKWFKSPESYVDKEQNIIIVKTDHFTDFTIQPTLLNDLTPQDLMTAGHAYGNSESVTGNVTVSPEGGTMMTECTEFVIHGYNGFEFPVKRIYDTQTARMDGPNFNAYLNIGINFTDPTESVNIISSLLSSAESIVTNPLKDRLMSKFQNDGDFSLGIGAGWRLNLPYVSSTDSGIILRHPNGSYYNINQMKHVKTEKQKGELSETVFENHSGDDFIYKTTRVPRIYRSFYKIDEDADWSSIIGDLTSYSLDALISQIKSLYNNKVTKEKLEEIINSFTEEYKKKFQENQENSKLIGIVQSGVNILCDELELEALNSELILKDGTSYIFDEYGCIKKITDGTGRNTISFEYNNEHCLSAITDPYGNNITVNTASGWEEKWVKPFITGFSFTDNRKIQYTQKDGETAFSSIVFSLPLLNEARDFENRQTTYSYDGDYFVVNGGLSAKIDAKGIIMDLLGLGTISSALGLHSITLGGNLGVEWPHPMVTINAPEKAVQQISYKNLGQNQFSMDATDYILFGTIPTALTLGWEYMNKAAVEYVIDGNRKTTYTYSEDSCTFNADSIFVKKCTITESYKKDDKYIPVLVTENNYDLLWKYRYNYNDLYSNILTTIKNAVNMFNGAKPQITQYSCSSMTNSSQYMVKADKNELVSFTEYLWEDGDLTKKKNTFGANFMVAFEKLEKKTGEEKLHRLLSETTTKGNITVEKNYLYDDWGNITNEEISEYKIEENKKQLQNYKLTENGYTSIEEKNIHNLLAEQNEYVNKANSVGTDKTVLAHTRKTYEYTSFGQLAKSVIYDGDIRCETNTEYYDEGEFIKLPKKVLSAEGNITEYRYRKEDNNLITETKIWKDKKETEDDDKNYVTTESAIRMATNLTMYEKDGNGHKTSYEYDKLGRTTKIIHPGNIYEKIKYTDNASGYNDSYLPVITVSKEDEKEYEVYSYDRNHNLLSLTQHDYKDKEETNEKRTIITKVTYDSWNRPVTLTDQNDHLTIYSYDALGRMTSQINPDETEKTFVYDNQLNKRTSTDENGHIIEEYLNSTGNVTKLVQNPGGGLLELVTVTEYDGNGRPVKVTDPMNQVTTTEYSVFGKEKKITRPSVTVYEGGNSRTVTPVETVGYNKDGLPVIHRKGYDGNWRVEETGYDGTGRAVSKKTYGNSKENARTVTYTYDGAGNVTAETQYVLENDESGKEVTKTYTRTWTYTERNQKKTETDPCNATVSYRYDRNDQMSYMRDAMGFEAEYVYDDYKRLIKAELPAVPGQTEKNTVTITYDACGNALSMKEADGRITTWTYDSRNRKTSETVSGSSTEEKTEKTFEYDDAGNLTAETAGGYRTEYTYDALNRLSETEKPDGQKLTNTYDKLGRVTKTEDAEGNTKQYEYNSLNFVTRQTDEGGDITDYGCSVWGEQTYRREHNSGGSGEQVWNITYDDHGEITEEEKNDGSIWMYEYDERGLVTGKTEPNGTEASYTYDACGRVTKETRTAENSTRTETKSYSYDKNGFMLSASDNGVTTTYNGGKSNAYGLITKSSTTAGGKTLVTSYTYDKGLRVSEIAYPDTRTVNYTYNSTGFLKAAGSGKKSDGNTTAYAKDGKYNTAGQLTSLTAGNGKTTTRTWNVKEGTLASYSWGLDEYVSRTLTWDVRGNITSIKKGRVDSPYTNTYSYDVRNRLESETNGAKVSVKSSSLTGASYRHAQNDISGNADGSLSSQAVSLDYNAASVIIDLGSDREITSLNIYGRNGRIDPQYLEVWTKESSSEGWQKVPVASLSWNKTTEGWCVYFIGGTTAEEIKLHSTWDERDADYSPVDRSTFSALVKNIFEVSFTADGKTSSWIYDAKGNRLSETESTGGIYSPSQSVTYYPNTDLIKTYGEWKFNYDRNGSLTSRGKIAEENQSEEEPFASWIFDASDGEVWYYEYDMSGRMTKSGSSKKGTSGLTERAAYAYDYRGLLVQKTYAEFTADEGVSITGGSTVKVTEWYEYTQDGRLLYTEKSAGSVTTKTDYIWAETTLWCEVDDGEVYYHHTDHLGTTEAVTDSTGKVVWHAEYEAFGSVLSENGSMVFTPGFTGKMLDDCSGLYYFNARWYDSECGRFTTSDPIRDGVNFHNYCNGNPLTRIDWTGLDTLDDFEYQLKTNEGLLTQVVTDTAAKGEYCIPFADFTDSKGNSLTGRLAKGLTSSDGQAALQDKTRAYVNSLSQEELEGSINKATVVTGIDPNDVKDAINQLNRYGFDIQFDPTGGDAFSIGGYLFVFNKLNKIGSATTENGVTKYRFNKENEEDQKGVCHENVHLQSALAFGNLFHWFANYNNEFMKNKENGMSDDEAYYSLPDEREAYSFGPNNQKAQKFIKNTVIY